MNEMELRRGRQCGNNCLNVFTEKLCHIWSLFAEGKAVTRVVADRKAEINLLPPAVLKRIIQAMPSPSTQNLVLPLG